MAVAVAAASTSRLERFDHGAHGNGLAFHPAPPRGERARHRREDFAKEAHAKAEDEPVAGVRQDGVGNRFDRALCGRRGVRGGEGVRVSRTISWSVLLSCN